MRGGRKTRSSICICLVLQNSETSLIPKGEKKGEKGGLRNCRQNRGSIHLKLKEGSTRD